ncbi:monovalent cation/H(+) antiporter subunit G [Legionella clemsonensis]|uniref:Na(+)/H(+) antiporter subunit G n=1 Tax=Legionella clemsonensis TaxID=1867846 RepID=A0A222P1N9_9GAMM|nr:monovalent cation/H(+) antiporter subunit G [Legionella clemsonensis]ASQ45753.1 Na(+)/H(+) antiporter subunit G [Legionella clemsonensis]
MNQIIALFAVSIGSFFIFIAAVGILKMPDIFIRMHAATKAGTLGCGLILIGATIYFLQIQVAIESFLTLIFIYITAPIASHLIARSAYAQNVKLSPSTTIDELSHYYQLASKNDNDNKSR